MNLGRPRVAYEDFAGQPIDATLTDGSHLTGTITALWMNTNGLPLMLRVDTTDVAWTAIASQRALPALTDGWHGPNQMGNAPFGCQTYSDGNGNTWWRDLCPSP